MSVSPIDLQISLLSYDTFLTNQIKKLKKLAKKSDQIGWKLVHKIIINATLFNFVLFKKVKNFIVTLQFV